MSCPNATAPIDIVKNSADTCDKKCDLAFDYPKSSVTASNKGDYIRFSFDKSATAPVFFNKEKFDVQEMRLYQPSLHTFSGSRTIGEVVIVHNNLTASTSLLVCVPITADASSATPLDALISQVSKKANSIGTSASINLNVFTLNNVVPSKPYYFYNGTLPYSPCNGSYDIVVFDKDNAAAINAGNLINLKRVLTSSDYDIHKPKNGLYYNSNGPSNMTSGDDIYIECNPTGDDGTVLLGKKKESDTTDSESIIKKIIESNILNYLIGAILLLAVIYIFNLAFSKIFAVEQSGGSINPPSATNS